LERTLSFITPHARTNLCCPPYYQTEPFLSQAAISKLLFIFLQKSATETQETLPSAHNFSDKLSATPMSVKKLASSMIKKRFSKHVIFLAVATWP